MPIDCPLCQVSNDRILFANDHVLALWDACPVTDGHLLIVPRHHVINWGDLDQECQLALLDGVDEARRILRDEHSVDGFNVGFNDGKAAGQSILHFHIHVIPRRYGDVADSRGGIRQVVPAMSNDQAAAEGKDDDRDGAPHGRALIAGGDDPLIGHLRPQIDRAIAIDAVIAFVLDSGARLLLPHLQDLLNRGGKIRFLVGDYLEVTDPIALRRMLDLEGATEFRVFEAGVTSFHPKAWLFEMVDGTGLSIVGSSNLSETALQTGIEWNYRAYNSLRSSGWREVQSEFLALFNRSEAVPLSNQWIDSYEKRRRGVGPIPHTAVDAEQETPTPIPEPHIVQRRALEALKQTRANGHTAGLVVLATGLGKTWLSAFDSVEFPRILFVAHREEILNQAMATFRRIRPDGRFGRYVGEEREIEADVLFASIQTLGRIVHLRHFPSDSFDYIIVDEFHHAAARTYRTLIEHFTPKFLLGLTATPERADGGDLLGLCQENLVFRCDMFEGIENGLLCPFRYFGVPDEVDYAQIPWRSAAFDEAALTNALATRARAQNAFEQHQIHGGARTIGFCCSRIHADFMADYFRNMGVRAVSVHSGESSAPRATSLQSLQAGELDAIFAVDIFNEGVDLPEIDTVLMLRPTESSVIWLQQFGRGLRNAKDKVLKVIDYIGNHRIFLTKARALLQVGEGERALALSIEALRRAELSLPEGCEVTYDLKALDILESLLRPTDKGDALDAFYSDFVLRHGVRPTALEVYHADFDPSRTGHEGWFGLVEHKGGFDPEEAEVYKKHGDLLASVARMPMTRSREMLVLGSMIGEEAFPGEIQFDRLLDRFVRVASRNPQFKADLSVPLNDTAAIRRLLVAQPIKTWTSAEGTGGRPLFEFDGDVFSTAFSVGSNLKPAMRRLVTEVVDWKIAQYLNINEPENEYDYVIDGASEEKANFIADLHIWKDYSREGISNSFGEKFNPGKWNSGIVVSGDNMILLVTLKKGNLALGNEYEDRFIDVQTFHWQSQTQTTQQSKRGRIISGQESGFKVHLFIRPSKLRASKAAPFTYCGIVKFVSWEGEKPISVIWRLQEPLPDHLYRIFGIERPNAAR